jgi:hypothetical protein
MNLSTHRWDGAWMGRARCPQVAGSSRVRLLVSMLLAAPADATALACLSLRCAVGA